MFAGCEGIVAQPYPSVLFVLCSESIMVGQVVVFVV